jgi:5-methylthioadenosine/S-adenosylhomocysteine deaminase
MFTTLIRSRTLFTRPLDRRTWEQIDGGAVLQTDGVIAAVGTYEALRQAHPDVPVVGTGNEVLLPGFVNGHHHVGLTPLQLGSPDMPLELWFITRIVARTVDPYLDTLYSAFEMVASGITTVQHLHGRIPGGVDALVEGAGQVIRAYEDIGMRVSYSYMLRDQNRLVYQADDAFLATLPAELQGPMRRWFDRLSASRGDHVAMFETLVARHRDSRRVRIQLSPANLHWCSDEALALFATLSEKHGAPMHMHLNETAYQKEYATRRGGGTALEHIDRFGLLGPRMTIGHGVWLNEADIDRVAETGTCICHNCSSNFRLRSGTAPLNRFEAKGITVAIGIEEAGINDDRDMLQEMRLVLRAHRVPGMDDAAVPSPGQVLRMATTDGARTTPFGDAIGAIEVGRAADMVLIDWQDIAYPYLDPETPVLDAVILRAKTGAVRTVMCDGEVIYADGRFTRVDRDGALKALHDQLSHALADDEVERRQLAKALLPYVRRFYEGYIDPARHEPFYRGSSRV